jgi:hypothetical protein
MAHFAELDETNTVKRVIVINNDELLDENGNESEQKGIDFCVNLLGGTWIQTSYNKNFRFNYAAEGMIYDSIRDAFMHKKPVDGEWQLDESTLLWEEIDPEYPRNWFYRMGAKDFFDRNMTEFIDKPNLKFLEIGSWVGTSAIQQIENFLTGENSTITCVDIWDKPKAEQYFDERTAPYADKITKVKSDSKIWLEENQDKLFDFIYIDGDHSATGIESDTRLSWPMLKIGGVMALDDVLYNEETAQANNAFVESVKDKSTIIENGYQIWLRKTAE